jgi:Na+-transporting methylmalonyl-CoA/oxaloacetate decarboxylase gamma subunit
MFALLEVTNLTLGEAAGYSILGLSIVFAALIILMGLIKVQSAIMGKMADKKAAPVSATVTPVAPSAPVAPANTVTVKTAPGSAGEIKLYDTPDKTAAMIMAIVADSLKKPLNELRFKSIKEVK